MTLTSANHGQPTVEDQTGSPNQLASHSGNPSGNSLHDDEYVDFSVASDTGDEGLDETDMDDSEDSNANNDTGGNANDNGADHINLQESEGTESGEESEVRPTIVHFPGKRAGEVYSRGITSMQEYENALGGPSENPHFPFTSKTDWELAKWAKLRGPSATSFTELLNISGVSINPNRSIVLSHHPCLAARAIKSIIHKFEWIK